MSSLTHTPVQALELIKRLERDTEILSLEVFLLAVDSKLQNMNTLVQAEVCVQEFQAIMLDLGQCRVQDDVPSSTLLHATMDQHLMQVIIFEPGDWTHSRVLGTSDDLDEIVDVGSTLIFVLLMLYPFIPVSQALLFDPTW